MIEFEWIWFFAFLPLPWIMRMLLPAANATQDAALWVPNLSDFSGVGTMNLQKNVRRWPLWLAVLAWILLLSAGARPQWIGETIELPVSGRDLMLAVDLSGSMEVEDFVVNRRAVDRLSATKAVASRFIERRIGDRLGLILFGRQAYLQTPLTFDRETVKVLLNESVIGLAGKETAIGDAIGLAVKRFRETKSAAKNIPNATMQNDAIQKHRSIDQILILLTDGANTAGEVAPIKAAELAASEGLKIYTIGIGADEMLVRSFFGSRKVNPSADLDEKTLKAIAAKTGGRYFRARDTNELLTIYAMLDELEPIVQETQSFRPKQALYFWPLSISLLLGALITLRLCRGH
jgi:Ca-activated chloride channel family protein